MDASCKKSLRMTSYGGIIRIRLKGRSSVTSSQPANTSSPVILLYYKSKNTENQVLIYSNHKKLLKPRCFRSFFCIRFPEKRAVYALVDVF